MGYRLKQRGLTLIEVMVSIMILSLVMIAVTISSSHVMKTTQRLYDRTLALWVAQAVLLELQTGSWGVVTEHSSFSGDMKMGQTIWHWIAQAQPVQDMIRMDVGVFAQGAKEPLLSQQGYVGQR